jgi:hypothetical protein
VTSAFGGQHSIQLSYGCSATRPTYSEWRGEGQPLRSLLSLLCEGSFGPAAMTLLAQLVGLAQTANVSDTQQGTCHRLPRSVNDPSGANMRATESE